MLKEDVGIAIEEDEEALNKLSRRTPLLQSLLGTNVPRPAELAKAAGPATQGEDVEPEKDSTLDPVGQIVQDRLAFLFEHC